LPREKVEHAVARQRDEELAQLRADLAKAQQLMGEQSHAYEGLRQAMARVEGELAAAHDALRACREVFRREGYKMDTLGLDMFRILGPEVKR
jgi:hypothetical protein